MVSLDLREIHPSSALQWNPFPETGPHAANAATNVDSIATPSARQRRSVAYAETISSISSDVVMSMQPRIVRYTGQNSAWMPWARSAVARCSGRSRSR